ncbi:MAG: hypothetical protein AAF614_30640 [Chloroflexota bacterium]
MSKLQTFLARILPANLMADVEAESRSWRLACSCGHATSVWEIGGIRYKAASSGKRIRFTCKYCGQRRWHRMYYKAVGSNQ